MATITLTISDDETAEISTVELVVTGDEPEAGTSPGEWTRAQTLAAVLVQTAASLARDVEFTPHPEEVH